MLDQGAGGRHEYGLVAVYPSHQIRGRAIGAMNFGDDTFPVSVARVTAPDHDLVSHFCAHFFPPYHRCRQPGLRTDGQTGPKVRTGRAPSWLSAPDVPCAKTARPGTAPGVTGDGEGQPRQTKSRSVSWSIVFTGTSHLSRRRVMSPTCRGCPPGTGRYESMPTVNTSLSLIGLADPCKQVGNFLTKGYLTPYDRYAHASGQRPAAAGDGRRSYGVGLAGSAVRKRAAAHVRAPTGLFLD